MEHQTVQAELRAALPDEITLHHLAAEVLARSVLATHYPPEFGAELFSTPNSDGSPPRTFDEWLSECSRFIPTDPPPAPEHLFLTLVLVGDEEMAREFRRARPDSQGFEQICGEFVELLGRQDAQRWEELVGTSPTLTDRRFRWPLAKAIDRRRAEFTQVAEAWFFREPRFNNDARSRRTYERFHLPILDAFEAEHGEVAEEYWCRRLVAGVVRTERGRKLHFAGNIPDGARMVMLRCEELRQRASEFLVETEYEQTVGRLYSLLSHLFEALDTRATDAGPQDLPAAALVTYEKRLDELEKWIDERAARRARRWYVAGTGIGLLALVVLMAPLIAVNLGDWGRLFEGAVFGAAGALSSVLFRMHRGKLQVSDPTEGRVLVQLAAAVRPLMGALFGGIVVAVALSGILPVDVPQAKPSRSYFLGVLGFIAGFSERWAPDLLDLTERQVAAQADPGSVEVTPENTRLG